MKRGSPTRSSRNGSLLYPLKCVLALAVVATTTQAWSGNTCDNFREWNSITGLDANFSNKKGDGQDHGEEPPIHALLVSPEGPLEVTVGDRLAFEIVAADANGEGIVNTEAAIYMGSYDPETVALLFACGGDDEKGVDTQRRKDCEVAAASGLTPAYHRFVNDGKMMAYFQALAEGSTTLWFAYPGVPHDLPPEQQDICETGAHGVPKVQLGGLAGWYCSLPGPPTHVVRLDVTVLSDDDSPPADADGDGVVDADDDCPGTPPNTPVDAHGCTDTDEDGTPDTTDPCPTDPTDQCNSGSDPPTTSQVAPGFYDFAHSPPTTFECGTTSVGAARWVEASIEPDFHGVDQPVFETLFTGSQLFTSVGGMYDPATGEYLSSGSGSDGNFFSMSGFWTTVNGNPFFEGTLTEDRASCANVFPVTLTRRASNPGPHGEVVSISSSRSVQVGQTIVLEVNVFDNVGNLVPGSDPFVAATRSANNLADVEAITIVSKDEGTPSDGIVHYTIRGNFAAQATVVFEYPGSPHDTTVVTVTP